MSDKVLDKYTLIYPQLSLPIEEGMSQNMRYTNIVRKGIFPDIIESPFTGSTQDNEQLVSTPVGEVNVLTIGNREDFIRFYRAIAYKCEPYPIPDSVGAACIFGVVNWNRIHEHKAEYLRCGGMDWSSEVKAFTAVSKNYKDDLCIVSTGSYSNLPILSDTWIEESIKIRTWHEITHIVCRRLYIENKDAIRDEVVADMMGLLFTYGRYDGKLALRFLGIENGQLTEGARLYHYVPEEEIESAMDYACDVALQLEKYCADKCDMQPFDILKLIEENRIGIK